jgi:hypothetical protein
MDLTNPTEADLRTWSYEQLVSGFAVLGETIKSLEGTLQMGPIEGLATEDSTSDEVVRCGRAQDMIIREMTQRKTPDDVAADLSIDLVDLTRRLATEA